MTGASDGGAGGGMLGWIEGGVPGSFICLRGRPRDLASFGGLGGRPGPLPGEDGGGMSGGTDEGVSSSFLSLRGRPRLLPRIVEMTVL